MAKLLPAQYAKVLYEMTREMEKKDLPRAVETFVQFLYREQAIKKADRIITAFESYAKKQAGIVELTITAAQPLSEKSLTGIKKVFGEKAEVQMRQDHSLLGGVIIQKDTLVLDGSIRTQLQELKRKLTV